MKSSDVRVHICLNISSFCDSGREEVGRDQKAETGLYSCCVEGGEVVEVVGSWVEEEVWRQVFVRCARRSEGEEEKEGGT